MREEFIFNLKKKIKRIVFRMGEIVANMYCRDVPIKLNIT